MIELLLTSFPVLIRYIQLRLRGEAMTIWNMKTALYAWACLAFALFVTIFYFHPKSYTGLVPFRTISVVAQANGPVTEVAVENGQAVKAGDLLFRIENSSQTAALTQAKAELAQLDAAEAKAKDALTLAKASVTSANASLAKLQQDLDQAQTLLDRNVGTQDKVRELEAAVISAEATLEAAEAQTDVAETDLSQSIPAQRAVAEAAVQRAQVELDHTEVRAYADGTVTQMAMSVGSPASQLVLRPGMVIIPERGEDAHLRVIAGFPQVARATLYEGMPAEIACESNLNLSNRDAVLPAHIVAIQPAIASGQVTPGGDLLEPSARATRGSILVYFELLHPEHEAIMLDGSGCIIQTYTNRLPGVFGHVISATGVVKAAGLRLKVWGALIAGVGLGGGGH